MKPITLESCGVTMRLVDYDVRGHLLQTLIEVVKSQCELMAPLPPSPLALTEALPGFGWYAIRSFDTRISVSVAEYDPGTYARFVLEGANRITVYIIYRVETGRTPSQLPEVRLSEGEAEVAISATESPTPTPAMAVSESPSEVAETVMKMNADPQQPHQSANSEWTQEQLSNLQLGVERYGKRWKAIASKYEFGDKLSKDLCTKWQEVARRTPAAINERRQEISKCSEGGGHRAAGGTGGGATAHRRRSMPQFTTQQTTVLMAAVAEHGQDWHKIAQMYDWGGRDSCALRKKWIRLQNAGREQSEEPMGSGMTI